VLAESFADQQATSEHALSAYLAYIERRRPDASAAKVYAVLEAACRVDEDEIAADRKRAFELNKRVIAANSDLEWPHYYLGVAYLQEGDLPAAMMNLTRARKRNPDRAMTYYWMGACHLRQSGAGLPAAIEWLSKFLAFPPENPHLAELQGAAAFELGKRLMRTAQGQAIPYLELAVARDAASAPHHFLLGQAYFETGRLDSSFEELTRACAIEPDLGDARALLAQVCLLGARYEDAETHSRAALRLQSATPAITGCLIAALYEQDKLGDAVAVWERTPTPEAGTEAVFCVARSYSRLGNFEAALACLEQLPREPRVVYYSGCALANLGRMEEARPRLQEIAAGDGEYATKALVELGTISLRSGDTGDAGACYDRALEQDPRDAGALYGMGSLAYRMGEMGVAADCFSKILARHGDDARAQFAMGAVSESRGDTPEAIRLYEAASNKLDVRLRLGVLYCRSGRYTESAQLLEPLYQSGVWSDAGSYYFGMALGFLNRHDEAIEMWSKLAERHPQDGELAAGLAEMYLRRALTQWDSREADGSLDQALVHDPQSVRCRYFRALYDWKRGKPADEADRLRDLAEQCDQDARILYHAGLRLLLDGAPEEALRYLERAARQRESDYGRYASWAIANHHAGQGQYAEAEAVLAGTAWST
jgi:tetratricopeptide (TPR) repeat protein